ncbi:hypothetical protein XAC3810_510080 [Xanthomonas citri pv. citri]|uniref:Uncharacterized protein n=1 Tax=Xanthomonas citri pv. citri TaxID=611301 RepID=A0A0U5FLS9_XANCI|nr:hypothetical protein XAC9322_520077 [Xanthomonas citri pv. citri]CEE30495.1 hypothetical protein XAC3824_660078 [Xanthomonas citri pv. citri]CEE31833.1 hypothetical protein XAC1083_510078 [Xanthomonas citri pv. citri]CEE41206.1 hypothetical protein XAC3810_510080 [Xanthomonas citri pv. citri]CEE43307.1 hypothetical protein XAC902_680078 [Xanthomonas citri pv. citri]
MPRTRGHLSGTLTFAPADPVDNARLPGLQQEFPWVTGPRSTPPTARLPPGTPRPLPARAAAWW